MTTELQEMGFGVATPGNGAMPSNTVGVALAGEEARIKAQLVMAMQHPRNLPAVTQTILDACGRPGLAEAATYEFRRGGQRVSGPSVDLARAMATLWTHVDSGYTIVEDTEDTRLIRCYAHDLCTGRRVTADQAFRKAIQRRDRQTGVTSWEKTEDQRSIREETAKWAAIGERNCLLQLIPRDVTDAALKKCAKTLHARSTETLEKSRADVVRELVEAFSGLDQPVSVEMLERYLGFKLIEIGADQLVVLRGVYKAIRDGNAGREEFFDHDPVGTPAKAGSPLDDLVVEPKEEKVDQTVIPPEDDWEPDASKVVDSKRQGTVIAAALKDGDLTQEAMQLWRRSVGLKKGDKMNQVQAAKLIEQIADGSVFQHEKDDIR